MEKRNKRIRSVEDMEGFQEYAEKVNNDFGSLSIHSMIIFLF